MKLKHRYLVAKLSLITITVVSTFISAHAMTFVPPVGSGTPSQATGGASRGNLFTPPPNSRTPSQTTGGASRGDLFIPAPGSGAPNQTGGGSSRGDLFIPVPGSGAPNQTGGGASRGDLFTPAPGNGTPNQASGGASRGDLFTPAPGHGSPTQTASGASRIGNASLMSMALVALLPPNFYGTTISAHPRFLVSIPRSSAKEAVFSLKDEVGNVHYQMMLPVAGKMGVVAIDLPTDAPALEIGKNYHWFLALKLDGQLQPRTPYVDGWVQRIQPTPETIAAMGQQDILKRVAALGKAGIWYDCVANLATLYATQPDNSTLIKHWKELLNSVGLKEIEAVPVLASTH